jgi:hypothetical protein
MPLIFTPSANSICQDWDSNFNILDLALVNSEILQQGLMLNTRVNGTSFNVPIPWFTNMIKTGLTFSLQVAPNANLLDYTLGTYQINAQPYAIGAGGTIVLNAGDATFSRVDVVYLTTSNTVVYLAGIAAVNPVAPTVPANTLIAVYIGVNPGASGAGGYTLVNVNLASGSTPLSPGILINQTLRWNGSSWVPNSGMLANGLKVTIAGSGFGTMDAITRLQVGGAIMIEDFGAPFPVTDKLYNVGGDLYWNGNLLTGPTGTVIGSHLRWDGTNFVEETNFLTLLGINSSWDCRFTSFDTGGMNTIGRIGIAEGSGFRGFSRHVYEPGNLTDGYEEFSMAYGGVPEYDLTCQDNNTGDNSNRFQSPTTHNLVVTDGVSLTALQQNKNQIRLDGGISSRVTLITANTALTNQYICLVRTSLGARTLTLPGVTTIDGTTYIIKDTDGLALANNITINTTGGATIEGLGSFVIASNYTSITIVYSSALNTWSII